MAIAGLPLNTERDPNGELRRCGTGGTNSPG